MKINEFKKWLNDQIETLRLTTDREGYYVRERMGNYAWYHEQIARLDVAEIIQRKFSDCFYEDEMCTCKEVCGICKGECGCVACFMAYGDFLSSQ